MKKKTDLYTQEEMESLGKLAIRIFSGACASMTAFALFSFTLIFLFVPDYQLRLILEISSLLFFAPICYAVYVKPKYIKEKSK